MEVMIYVEGRSDVVAMNELLRSLIQRKQEEGISIQFFEAPPGDKKKSVMFQVPKRAANILAFKPDTMVVAMPDLYPLNKEVPHETVEQLRQIIEGEFEKALAEKDLSDDARYKIRFKTFFFKYDLEALVLAAEDALALRLGRDDLKITWIKPVEDQNKDKPPKYVVRELFKQHDMEYTETTDAQLILGLADYHEIAEACPQCFKPFVEFLEGLTK